jgi:WS/DGAT/MGAT family acyltransferase
MQRLNGMDTSFLYGETPSWHMHAGALIVVDPSTAPGRFGVARLRSLIFERLGLLRPFRRRLVEVPFGLDRPVWIDDPHPDMTHHVRKVRVKRPGGERELGALVGEVFARKLDRNRPMWEIVLVEGLERGRAAIIVKVHHSLVDGVRGARLYELLLDASCDAPFTRPHTPAVRPERVPGAAEMVLRSVPDLVTTPIRAARTTRRLGVNAIRMIGFRTSSDWRAAVFPFQAPRTSFNHVITPNRELAFASVPLADVKAIKNAFRVTVNDVVLGICSGALRRYLAARGELPDRSLIAQIPIAVHVDDARDRSEQWGNRVSVMGAALATQIDDPVKRLHAIHASTTSGKAMHRRLGDNLVLDLAEVVPPGLLAAGVAAYTRLRLSEHHEPVFNLIVSNVPGPPVPVYLAGAQVLGTYPIGPLLDGSGLNISAFSYRDNVDFGFIVCPELVPDPWLLVDATVEALHELRDAAQRHDETSPRMAARSRVV